MKRFYVAEYRAMRALEYVGHVVWLYLWAMTLLTGLSWLETGNDLLVSWGTTCLGAFSAGVQMTLLLVRTAALLRSQK